MRLMKKPPIEVRTPAAAGERLIYHKIVIF